MKSPFGVYRLLFLSSLFSSGLFAALAQKTDEFRFEKLIDIQDNPDNQFRQAVSGIIFHEGTFFIAQERCNVMVIKGESKYSISVPNVPSNFELEGITLYNNSPFLIDENSKTVRSYGLDNKKSQTYKPPNTCRKAKGQIRDDDSFEGMVAHPVSGVFYFLHKRQKEGHAHVYTTLVHDKRNKFTTAFDELNDCPIKLKNFNRRYSDLFYDQTASRLLLIPSEYYPKHHNNGKNRYLIRELQVTASGRPQPRKLKFVQNVSITIKNSESEKGYDPNIEDLTRDSDRNLYLVSDNCHGYSKYCNQNIKKDDAKKDIVCQI